MNFDLQKHTIFECIVGSKAYGTDTPESDTDYRGVCIPPKGIAYSLFQRFEQHIEKTPDRVIYGLGKFMKLAADCNPSIITLLFIEEPLWVFSTSWWEEIRARRDMFLSTRARHSFSGYAISQLKRMQTHVRWMTKAPTEPVPEDFGISHTLFLGKDEVGAVDWLSGEGIKFKEEVTRLMGRVKGYQQALKEWKNYEEWRKNRNPARAEMEKKFGYDTKHSYHLVRLVRLGEELLLTGKMTIYNRPDVEEFRAIRRGEWSYQQLLEFAEGIDEHMAEVEKSSVLPYSPDRPAIDAFYQELIERYDRA